MNYIQGISKDIKKAATELAILSTAAKNDALKKVYESIDKSREKIISANRIDIENAKANNLKEGFIDRLMLDNERIDGILEGLKTVIDLPDPIGRSNRMWTVENGLQITKISVPLGVIAIIYEGRPNVTVDAFGLALKSGNAIILRGSSSAIESNKALEQAIKEGLKGTSVPETVIHLVKDTDRGIVSEILTANGIVDLAIPRGGHELISRVVREASVPTLETGEGNNHLYVDESADIDMALDIIKNAKLQRIGVCNALEKLLVHESLAPELLKRLESETKDVLEIHADEEAKKLLTNSKPLNEDELNVEYLDYILGVKVVTNIDEAIAHINEYGTKHSEAIVTRSLDNAQKFQKEVDAATVYVNASTRFTDGGVFGFGLEMGISTQKLHARGPVGLEELVSSKYLVMGNGQIR